jgi:hypothetical protein
MEVPEETQAHLRTAVAAVDPDLGARIDRCAPSALDIQDVIFEAQDKLVKSQKP